MMEIKEMAYILLNMGTDTYLQYKYTFLAANRGRRRVEEFTRKLFSLIDSYRPLPIEEKEPSR